MTCTKCTAESIEENARIDLELYEESHDYADILHCDACRKYYLQYWVEIWDDGWKYWVEIDERERNDLTQVDVENYQTEIIKLIRTKESVVCKHPSDEFYVLAGAECLLDGPPW